MSNGVRFSACAQGHKPTQRAGIVRFWHGVISSEQDFSPVFASRQTPYLLVCQLVYINH
jgi:hypothetical protein